MVRLSEIAHAADGLFGEQVGRIGERDHRAEGIGKVIGADVAIVDAGDRLIETSAIDEGLHRWSCLFALRLPSSSLRSRCGGKVVQTFQFSRGGDSQAPEFMACEA
jgi:hypothetical protein